MNGLVIDVPVDASFSSEAGFGNMSFNELDAIPQLRTGTSDSSQLLSFPVERLYPLGQGSSSIVYKSLMLNKLVVTAEKVFLIGDTKKKVQLFRELQSLKSLCSAQSEDGQSGTAASPFIVELLDVFSNPTDGTLSLCLEYMDCGSLENVVLSGGCADFTVLSSISFQMLSGLQFLHEKRLIHRDVKPSNALISSNGRVKLADFGLARTLDTGQSLANSFVGTFLYMAPERLTGEAYSFQSDLWSLGLTVHAVALGQFPYLGKKGYWEILNATQQGPPPISAAYPVGLKAFLLTCYQAEPRSRTTAGELVQLPFLQSCLDYIPEPLRALVCRLSSSTTESSHRTVPAPSTPSAPFTTPQPPRIAVPTHLLPQSAPCSVSGNLTGRSPAVSQSAKKPPPAGRKQVPGSVLSGGARTALVQQQQRVGRQVSLDSLNSRKGSASSSNQTRSGGPARPTLSKAGATRSVSQISTATATATTIALKTTNTKLTSTSAKASVARPGQQMRSLSAVRTKTTAAATSLGTRTSPAPAAETTPTPAAESQAFSRPDQPSVASDDLNTDAIKRLVGAWEKYITLARHRQERDKRSTVPTDSGRPPHSSATAPPKESYDYAASPSVAVSSLRRLVAKQHDAAQVFVTERMVVALARALPCSEEALRGEFCAAMQRINAAWNGNAVQRISSGAANRAQSQGTAGAPVNRPIEPCATIGGPSDFATPRRMEAGAEAVQECKAAVAASDTEEEECEAAEEVEDACAVALDGLSCSRSFRSTAPAIGQALDDSIEEDAELLAFQIAEHYVGIDPGKATTSAEKGADVTADSDYGDDSFEIDEDLEEAL